MGSIDLFYEWMEWLNYNHLYYFWVVAREGSVAAAAKELNVTQPTISAQLPLLEEALGEKLFEKSGRGLALTEAGRMALRYADEIFALGRELRDVLRDRPTGKAPRVTVGVADVVPKLVAYRVLRPAFEAAPNVEIVCREASPDRLIDLLAQHEVDLVLSDVPASAGPLRVFNQLIGESGTSFFASGSLARSARKGFPRSLNDAPLLLPAVNTQLRRTLEQWLELHEITPRRVAEFDDLALMTAFGRGGTGVFPAPTVIERDIESQYGVRVIGRAADVKERFYAVSAERKIRNPIASAIIGAARRAFEGRTA